MAKLDKQTEKWMSRASFDKLDLSTIPVGTEINIVGDIQESDLSLELQDKINGGGHLWKLTRTPDLAYPVDLVFYWNTQANTLEELMSELVSKNLVGIPQGTYMGVATITINSASINGNNIAYSGFLLDTSYYNNGKGGNATTMPYIYTESNTTLSVEKIY